MHSSKKVKELKNSLTNEGFLLFLCFLTCALIGYFLTHQISPFSP